MRRGKNKCVHVELYDVSGTLPSSTGQQDAGKKNIMGESNNKIAAGKKFPILAIVAVLFLVLLPISVYFGYAEYVRLQKEKERAMEAARREAQQIIEDARRTANAASEELKALRKQLTEGADTTGINQRQAQLRRDLNEAESKIRAGQQKVERPQPTRGILVGDTVELLKLGTKASVIAINKDGTYQLQAGILKLNAKPDEVYLLENDNPYKTKGRPAHSGREMKMAAMASEVDLRGMDAVEAVCVLQRYMDEAMRSNLSSVRIIHGKGTGVLRSAVHQELKKNKFVKTFRLGVYGEGEDGVTIAEFR